ncbi:hypothetical protein [Actinoalloteichus spitiensis]|uniref:hypothetical protein n=1 Tax=Actinoalloteichus spitiensis TaxID=252394 RepID=UPI000A019498|nr:hypothetical protein [Actinoalloteichus spitiensis]
MTNPQGPYQQGSPYPQGTPPPGGPGYGQPPFPAAPGYGPPPGQPGGGMPPAGFGMAPPPLSDPERRAGRRPATVNTAFVLWMANAVLGILAATAVFLTIDTAVARQVAASGVSAELGETVIGFARSTVLVAATISALLAGLMILFVFMMRAGRNWARIVLTVLGALSVLGTLSDLGSLAANFEIGGPGILLGILAVAQPLLIVGGVVMMYLADSNRYFRQS